MSFLKSKSDEGREILRDETESQEHPQVEMRWLVQAGAATFLAAVVLAYAAFCLLFYQGQWQVILHPSAMQKVPAKDLPPNVQAVHFAVNESGQPTMFGWWIPADKDAHLEADTVVYFPSGSGSLSARAQQVSFWHQQRINVFAFDYRGFGDSATLHPDEETLKQDAVSVSRYLTETRHIPASHMVFLGEGIGAVTATHAANTTPGLAAVILIDPAMSQLSVFQADGRTRLLPLHLLLHDEFNLAPELRELKPPSLVISTIGTQQAALQAKQVYAALQDKKSLFIMPTSEDLHDLTLNVDAFLDATVGAVASTPAALESGPAQAASPGK